MSSYTPKPPIAAAHVRLPHALIEMDLPVPPCFEECIGYGPTIFNPDGGDARFVAFYYGSKFTITDGRGSTCNMHNHAAEHVYFRHPAVMLSLGVVNLGGCDCDAEGWLMLDRVGRKMYVGTPDVVNEVLVRQWPAPEPREGFAPTQAHLDEMMAAVERRMAEARAQPQPTLMEHMHRRHELAVLLRQRLDESPQAARASELMRTQAVGLFRMGQAWQGQ